jgi:cytochrome c oxidase subunit II
VRSLLLTAVLAAGALGAAGCGGGGSSSSTPTPAKTPAATKTAAAGGAAAQGKALYASKGCQACHSIDGSKRTGPTWKGLAGSTVKLTGGKTAKADDTYLLDSIEDPDKQIVAGYQPGVMTSSIPKGSIAAADAHKLVAYIDSLR